MMLVEVAEEVVEDSTLACKDKVVEVVDTAVDIVAVEYTVAVTECAAGTVVLVVEVAVVGEVALGSSTLIRLLLV